MNYLMNILSIFVLGYFIFLVSTYIFQRNLLYHPKINNYDDHKLSVKVEKIRIKTSDNIELLSCTIIKILTKIKHYFFRTKCIPPNPQFTNKNR